MAKTPYMSRVCDEVLDLELSAAGAVLIEGPKWRDRIEKPYDDT